jgi:hypothetical protein
MMVGGDTPCRKSQETGKECRRRPESFVGEELYNLLKSKQPAPPVPAIRSNHDEHFRKAVQAVQNIRDFEWEMLSQYSVEDGAFFVWTCDCDEDDDDEEAFSDGVEF